MKIILADPFRVLLLVELTSSVIVPVAAIMEICVIVSYFIFIYNTFFHAFDLI